MTDFLANPTLWLTVARLSDVRCAVRNGAAARHQCKAQGRGGQHVPGPVHVRLLRPAGGRQQALPGNLRPVAGKHEARLHAARTAGAAHQERIVLRRPRQVHRRYAAGSRSRQAHQQSPRNERRPRDRARQSPAAWRRLGRDPRRHHRAAPGRAEACFAGRAGTAPRGDRSRHSRVPRAGRERCWRASPAAPARCGRPPPRCRAPPTATRSRPKAR